MSKTKLLDLTNDVVFQALFGEVGNERITKKLLENILNEKIESVDLSQNPILRRETKEDKLGVLDVIAKINNSEYVNIEMQMNDHPALIERMLYYWARKYVHQLKKANLYTELKRTVVVLITNFNLSKLKDMGYHTKWKIIDENHRKIVLTNKLELHIIQLTKIREKEDWNNELIDWLSFIKNPNSERSVSKMAENKELKEAHQKLETMSEDEKMQRFAEWRQDAIYMENTLYASGLEEGEKRGQQLGEKVGEERGKKEKQIEIAKKLLKMNISVENIAEGTGLTPEEVKKLYEQIS
jgi:predicted transposase/invertase (TIGR01784 family)